MANHKKSKNSFSKSLKYVFSQAKAGSLLHIGIITAVLLVIMLPIGLTACSGGDVENDGYVENEADQTYDKDREALDVEQLGVTVLKETEDAGQEYIDNTLFIGDSNTVRTQVYGHTTWDNVVAAVSMGVQHIPKLEMTYFKGMENPVTVPRAVKIIQPQRIIITYGTNNTLGFTVEDFIKMYREGIQAIEKQWPYADIIINAIPPIDKERENLAITMQTIDKMNKALAEMAKEDGYKFLNSAEALKDEETGFAKKDYTISDGVHLSKKGMDALFEYFRTHAYITEDRRPQPLKPVPERKETPTGIITEDPIAVRGSKIKVVFKSNDESLGTVSGEVEQKLKRTQTSSGVGPQPNVENGGVFTGWSCSYEGLSSTVEDNITYTVPKVGEEVTEITVYCNFAKASVTVKADGAQTSAISLDSGKSKQLSADITSGFKGDGKITWTSENTAVATVDQNGKVTAVGGGKTQIVASILNNKIYAVCEVTVKQNVESISISGEKNFEKGQSAQLTLTVNPNGAQYDKAQVKWSSDNADVAAVDSNGKVTAKKEGSATITATLGSFTATHTVKVTRPKPLTGISLTGPTELKEGEKIQLTVVYTPQDTTDSKKATWSSSNTAVATVSEGAVIGNSAGSAEITCTVGGFTAKITVTVKAEVSTEPTPTLAPTPTPTVKPTEEPTVQPTAEPTAEPTAQPTAEPTPTPVPTATPEPTPTPTPEPQPTEASQGDAGAQGENPPQE